MRQFQISCLIFVSLFLASCSKPYKNLVLQEQNKMSASFEPKFETELFRCVVDGKFVFKKFHLTGLLYFKNFSDTAVRIVFQNEMGLTYFDFGWDSKDSFQVNYIIEQMDKPALIQTLKKDFELLLFKNKNPNDYSLFTDKDKNSVYRYAMPKGFAFYILDKNKRLAFIENADEKRKVIQIKLDPPTPVGEFANQIIIQHLRANFTITLKKLEQDVIE